ncbi:hypothetical protein [Desulfovibrio sp. JC022]|uniref:IS66 family insertion sequence element accessory protein TnpA n=1 Tax=Desulfovibrio sp. JC022 TaxID=2593642 RepID=UPI0013D4915B|nr:hypothetical protein [Desulfovibrio sp. JC022]NDV24977.1 hypothetical protein [Desulfovibrio sp. JC022]
MPDNIESRADKEIYWQEQVDNWRKSGLSQAEFCRQVGISQRVLGYWKLKFENRGNSLEDQKVVAVSIAHENSLAKNPQPIIIHAWHGLRLEIPADFAPESLDKIFHVLGRLS